MKQYLELGKKVLAEGTLESNRTDTLSISIFGSQMRFDLSDRKLAAVTTKKLHIKSIIHELIWMTRGDTNTKYLNENGVRIWDEWANENGDLGDIYGKQWRNVVSTQSHGMGFIRKEIDQLAEAISKLQNNPTDRRIIVSSWNVSQLESMALPPCHLLFQFNSMPPKLEGGKRRLQIQCYQRSVDYFLGLPFNVFFYSILAHVVAELTNHEATELIHVGGNVHIYENHLEQVNKQLARTPKKCTPSLSFTRSFSSIDDIDYDLFEINDYKSHPHIAGKVSV